VKQDVSARASVLDSLDVETFFVCSSAEQARVLGLEMLREMGFSDVDVVFAEFCGTGARIRLRAYIHRPGDRYSWIKQPPD